MPGRTTSRDVGRKNVQARRAFVVARGRAGNRLDHYSVGAATCEPSGAEFGANGRGPWFERGTGCDLWSQRDPFTGRQAAGLYFDRTGWPEATFDASPRSVRGYAPRGHRRWV